MKCLTPPLITLLLIGLGATVKAQPAIEWQACHGTSGPDYANSGDQTSDGGYILAGFTYPNGADSADAWVVKLDPFGALEWQRVMGGSYWDEANSVQETFDGGYIVAGWTESNDGDVSGKHGGLYAADMWLVKLDSAGAILWQKCIGGSGDDFANDVQQTTDGGYVLTGLAYSSDGDVTDYNSGAPDVWVVKVDALATIQWARSFGGSSYEYSFSVKETNDNGYVVGGYTNSTDGDVAGSHGDIDAWILKLDWDGTLQWQKCLGGVDDDSVADIIQTLDGGYLIAGNSDSNDGDVFGAHGGRDAWIARLDPSGSVLWQRCIGGTNNDYANACQRTADGGYVVAGYTHSSNGDVTGFQGGSDVLVVKLDTTGTVQWLKCMGGFAAERAHAIHLTMDGGYVVVGETASTDGDVAGNHGVWDAWVVKLGPESVGFGEVRREAPIAISPNPTEGMLQVQLQAPDPIRSIKLQDTGGRVVLMGASSLLPNSCVLDLSALRSGLYLLQVELDDGTRHIERVIRQ